MDIFVLSQKIEYIGSLLKAVPDSTILLYECLKNDKLSKKCIWYFHSSHKSNILQTSDFICFHYQIQTIWIASCVNCRALSGPCSSSSHLPSHSEWGIRTERHSPFEFGKRLWLMHQYQQQQIETKYQDIQNHNSGDKPVYIYLNTLGVFKIHFLCGELKKKSIWKFFQIFILC